MHFGGQDEIFSSSLPHFVRAILTDLSFPGWCFEVAFNGKASSGYSPTPSPQVHILEWANVGQPVHCYGGPQTRIFGVCEQGQS